MISFRQARDSDLLPDERAEYEENADATEDGIEAGRKLHLIVRWRLEGTARPSLLVNTAADRSVYEGLSVYDLSPVDGKVVSHTIVKVVPAPPNTLLAAYKV